jgi:hypothetical protein
VPELPDGLTLKRNRDLAGRGRHPWIRRGLLCAIAALPMLALLDVFGQHPKTTAATGGGASLSVTAPSRLRSGLIYQARVTVIAQRDISQPTLVFDRGWWDSMSVNSIEPQPSTESSQDGRVALSFDKLQAGKALIAWIYFQVNPTNVGDRREDVELDDGSRALARVHRSLTIFP